MSARYAAGLRMPSVEWRARMLSPSIEPSNATTDYQYRFSFRPHWQCGAGLPSGPGASSSILMPVWPLPGGIY